MSAHPATPIKVGDPLVEGFAVLVQRSLHKHPNTGALAAWTLRLLCYGLLAGLMVAALKQLAAIPHVLGASVLWCLPRAILVTFAVCLGIAMLCAYPATRRFVQEQLPWSVLLLVMVFGVNRAASARAVACRAPALLGGAATPAAPAATPVAVPVPAAAAPAPGPALTVEALLRSELGRVTQAMLAERARTGAWPTALPATVQPAAGVRLGARGEAQGFVATAAYTNGAACQLTVRAVSMTQAKQDVRCGRAAP